MKIPFTKMHGIGNDYIYINCFETEIQNPEALSIAMSPRHSSVGADGVVLICPSSVADARMRMFNADGSEGKMCGNAIRCVGKYLYEHSIVTKTELTIETLSGLRYLTLYPDKDGSVNRVRVNMGKADVTPAVIPVLAEAPMISTPVDVEGSTYRLTAVSVGNPHAVCFDLNPDALNLEAMGPAFENHPLFPERVNTEFATKVDDRTLRMRVWERGSGETYACGTGACATVAAAVLNGICPKNEEITVQLRGGDLKILCRDDMTLLMEGAAETVYDGIYDFKGECPLA